MVQKGNLGDKTQIFSESSSRQKKKIRHIDFSIYKWYLSTISCREEGYKMNGKPDIRRKLLGISLVWFFLFLNVFAVSPEIFPELPEGRAAEISDQRDDSFYIDAAAGSIQKDAASVLKANVFSVRRLRENILKLSFLINIFFSVWVSFSLWEYLKRAFFSYLQSCYFHSVWFLRDLMIQWAKDGKKKEIGEAA